jgi:hypothetical protein
VQDADGYGVANCQLPSTLVPPESGLTGVTSVLVVQPPAGAATIYALTPFEPRRDLDGEHSAQPSQLPDGPLPILVDNAICRLLKGQTSERPVRRRFHKSALVLLLDGP